MAKVRFTTSAKSEYLAAVAFYNESSPGLGFEFADAMRRSIEQILRNPDAWQSLSKNTRRYLIRRFPYGVIYQVRKDQIVVIGVMHLKRHPQAWQELG